jgi:hypothetical protein
VDFARISVTRDVLLLAVGETAMGRVQSKFIQAGGVRTHYLEGGARAAARVAS